MKIITILLFCSTCFAQVKERWAVKTCADGFVPSGKSVTMTVKEIAQIKRVKVTNQQPRMEEEKQLVVLSGIVKRIALEADGDYHIEVSDGTLGDSTVVCEIPACSPGDHKKASKLVVGYPVKVAGLIFQDKFHSPSPYRTRNFIEIHPVLFINAKN